MLPHRLIWESIIDIALSLASFSLAHRRLGFRFYRALRDSLGISHRSPSDVSAFFCHKSDYRPISKRLNWSSCFSYGGFLRSTLCCEETRITPKLRVYFSLELYLELCFCRNILSTYIYIYIQLYSYTARQRYRRWMWYTEPSSGNWVDNTCDRRRLVCTMRVRPRVARVHPWRLILVNKWS